MKTKVFFQRMSLVVIVSAIASLLLSMFGPIKVTSKVMPSPTSVIATVTPTPEVSFSGKVTKMPSGEVFFHRLHIGDVVVSSELFNGESLFTGLKSNLQDGSVAITLWNFKLEMEIVVVYDAQGKDIEMVGLDPSWGKVTDLWLVSGKIPLELKVATGINIHTLTDDGVAVSFE